MKASEQEPWPPRSGKAPCMHSVDGSERASVRKRIVTLMKHANVALTILFCVGVVAGYGQTSGTQPDNTNVNERDRNPGEATADQQKVNATDRDLTQKTRQSVIEDKSITTSPAPQDKKDDSQGQQTKRMFWLVPNFAAVSANTQLPPLSTREKFKLAASDSVTDYSSYTWAAILAGQAMALNSDPEFGHGAAGYGRYYWRNVVDGISGTFFTEAIVPAMTHEDPRYYTMGKGGFFRRTAYAISMAFVTKKDSGGTTFNWSEVGGNALEAGLASAYYPPQERGASETARNFGTQMESAVLNHVFQEFWPDIRTKIFRRK